MKPFLAFFIALSCWCSAEDLPDAPSREVWSGKKIGTWHEVVHDPKWYVSTLAFVGSSATEYVIISKHEDNCIESNPNLGPHPKAGDFARDFAETHLPVIVLGTLIHKVTVRSKWSSWIYPSMMAYGTQMHVRGSIKWMGCR